MTEEKFIEEVREFPCIWDTCSRVIKTRELVRMQGSMWHK